MKYELVHAEQGTLQLQLITVRKMINFVITQKTAIWNGLPKLSFS
jgi:hypothetical protein